MTRITISDAGSADDYFLGRRLSDNLTVRIEPDGEVLPRTERLVGLVKGRSVLHVGCCDHTTILEQRLVDGLWLHKTLAAVAQRCLGIDIDAKAVEQVKSVTGFDNLIAADITKPGVKDILSAHWDVALFGDVLEHVHAPVDFLSGFRINYGKFVDKIVVSVPNNMRAGNATGALRNRETINSDPLLRVFSLYLGQSGGTFGLPARAILLFQLLGRSLPEIHHLPEAPLFGAYADRRRVADFARGDLSGFGRPWFRHTLQSTILLPAANNNLLAIAFEQHG
jgi:hypothetical protein